MDRPTILHLFTPTPQASPFDVNMAADAGYQLIVPYCGVALDSVAALTQDAIFSRGPKGVARTGIFIGGRDVVLAEDMRARAVQAMVPPFAVSVLADPSGAFTTAAALVAGVEAALRKHHGTDLQGKTVLLLGGTGAVGRVAAVLCARAGARALIASRHGQAVAQTCADDTGARFGVTLHGAPPLEQALPGTHVVLGVAAAGVQVLSQAQLQQAPALLVAADVNAVPPAGIAGVGVMDDGVPIAGTRVVGLGALAVGNIKYQTQHRLLRRMCEAGKPLSLGHDEAMTMAREVLAQAESNGG